MDLHSIPLLVSIPLEIVLIFLTVLHLRSESKKRKRDPNRAKPYQPTFPIIIVTLFSLAVIAFLLMSILNPRPFEIVRIYWSLIKTAVMLTVMVSGLSILLG